MTSLALWILWAMMQVGQNGGVVYAQSLHVDHCIINNTEVPCETYVHKVLHGKKDPNIHYVQLDCINGETIPWSSDNPKFYCMNNKWHEVPPMDVPAIQVPADSELESMSGGDIFSCSNGGKLNLGHCSGGHTYTCADKSRVLLTDEEGGRHCVKF